jgi:TolB-like protein/Tfp pilus assembly protein PilF
VAVLPFANLSSDPENEYFADGLSEELLSVLSKVRGLRVAARVSSFHFKGQTGDVRAIARRLRVATVLSGSVRKAGRRVRIAAQLVHGSDGYPIWAESYDRELKDIFAVQDAIAQHVVEELRAALLGEAIQPASAESVAREVRSAARGRSEGADAYGLYLQGRHFVDRFTREDVARGMEYLRRALALEPDYALAWACLARAHATEAGYGWAPVMEGYEQARLAADRALSIEPDLADALAVLGRVRLVYDRDPSAAEALYRRALELAPGDTFIVRAAAVLARNAGRLDDAIALLRPAAANDPLNEPAHFGLALCHYWAGDPVRAEAGFRKALELNPTGAATSFYLAAVLAAQSRLDEAEAVLEREPLEIFRLLGGVLLGEARGSAESSRAALAELRDRFAAEAAYQIAAAHAIRGERDEAFAWLARAFDQRDSGIAEMRPDIHLRSLRADPRWTEFLDRLERGT